jgi:putative hydrolase of the HAD superfamily
MSEFSTILWDVGGVLLTNGWDHTERNAVLAHFGLDREEFEMRHPGPNDLWEKGLLTVEQYLEQTVFYQPRSFTPQEFFELMKAQSKLLPETGLPVLREIAASGTFELATVNNEARELNDYRIRAFGLLDYIDCFLSSCYVGKRKPDPSIYRLALDVLQRDPEEVVFVDDREGNVEAARTLGIRGIVFKNAAQLSTEFSTLGIAAAA